MLGERTWTSAMSGAATNTVAAGPGSLSAVPLLTSSVSVGASVGTTWLWPNGRPAAPPVTTGAGGLAGPAAGGWIGTGAGDGVGAWANCGAGADGVTATGGGGGTEPTAASGVSDAVIARTACSARSASRRLRSSETLSVAVCLDTGFLAGGRGGGGVCSAVSLGRGFG